MRIFRLFALARRSVPRVLPLMRDARVPLRWKWLTFAAALLIVSPLDIFGDIPIVGLFDDAALLALLASLFVYLADRHIMRAVDVRPEPRTVRPLALQKTH